MTLGPVGTVTQALSSATPQSVAPNAKREGEVFQGSSLSPPVVMGVRR